jgi:hypothetical protein
MLKYKNWRRSVEYRDAWRRIVEAKTLAGWAVEPQEKKK